MVRSNPACIGWRSDDAASPVELESAARRGPIAKFLPQGELVILHRRPSVLYLLLNPLYTYLSIAVFSSGLWWLLHALSLGPGWMRVPWLGVLALALRFGWEALEWWSRAYVLTDQRVVVVAGVLRQGAADLPLHRVQHVAVFRSLRERLFGLGSIGFATAGSGTIEASWRMLDAPGPVLDVVRRTVSRAGGRP